MLQKIVLGSLRQMLTFCTKCRRLNSYKTRNGRVFYYSYTQYRTITSDPLYCTMIVYVQWSRYESSRGQDDQPPHLHNTVILLYNYHIESLEFIHLWCLKCTGVISLIAGTPIRLRRLLPLVWCPIITLVWPNVMLQYIKISPCITNLPVIDFHEQGIQM